MLQSRWHGLMRLALWGAITCLAGTSAWAQTAPEPQTPEEQAPQAPEDAAPGDPQAPASQPQDETAPADGGDDAAPAGGGDDAAPADGGDDAASAGGGDDAAPAGGGDDAAPADAGQDSAGEAPAQTDQGAAQPASPAPQPAPQTAPQAPASAPDEAPSGEVDATAGEADATTGEAGPSEPLEGKEEVIVITGSRIRTDPLDSPAPVLQLTSEEIERTGLTSVADLLQRLPTSGGALNTKFNSSGNFGFPPDGGGIGAGSAQAEMRYLGPKRVLVLVDGVRWVNGSSGSGVPSATDLNTIPIGMIERIEVLEDGASPIYGSDAIGGVVNIITKKNWEGVSANAYLGGYNQGDGMVQQYDVTWGQKNERMSMVFGLSYVDQNLISADDRAISRYPKPGIGRCTGYCSSGTPQGRFVFTDPNTGEDVDVTINDGVDGVPVYDPTDPNNGGDFHAFDIPDRFNYSPYNLLLTPSQRLGMFGGVEYELTPEVKVYARALFNNRQSANRAAPEPLFIGPDAGNGNRLDTIVIHETNPYNPFGFTLDGDSLSFMGRRPLEAGPRLFEQNVNTAYVSGGLQGDFAVKDSKFYWDANVAYGINRADQVKHGAFNSAKLEKALGPVDACMDDPECVPLNLFGGQGANGEGTITQEMLDYVTFVQKDVSQQQLFDVTANISGELLQLPSGALSMAAGVEHRRQEGFFLPDSVVTAGDSAGVPSSPTSGDFTVNEGYAEVRVPILAKFQGADLLDVNGAVRFSDYSTFGAESTLKAGMRWRPIKDLMVRGSYAQGFRAPGIGELFGSEARFDQTLDDPCSDMRGLNSGTEKPQEIIDNCIELGVPEDGSYEQINSQISVTTGGNRDLDAETSNSYNASLVYSPSWLEEKNPWIRSLDLEMTYYRIELDGAIQALDAQVQLDSCVQTLDPVLCSGISRTPNGVINSFANQLTNIGGIDTSGLDFKLTYLMPYTDMGGLRVTSLSSVLLEFTESIPSADGFDEIAREGTEIGDPERAFPRFKSSLIFDWFRREWRASLTLRYIHSVTEACRGLEGYGLCSDYDPVDDSNSKNVLGATVYGDVQASYTPEAFENRLDLTVGVNNLFNTDPPMCFSCALNGFDATTYDVPGMFGYVKAGYRMW